MSGAIVLPDSRTLRLFKASPKQQTKGESRAALAAEEATIEKSNRFINPLFFY